MAEFCRQCSISHGFPLHDDFAATLPEDDLGELEEGFGFPVLCEGCGPVIVDYLGQCIGGNCEGCPLSQPEREADHNYPSKPHDKPQVIYRTWESAQVMIKKDREAFEAMIAKPGYWETKE